MPTDDERRELGRRARAAIAYNDAQTQVSIAKYLSVSVSTLTRMLAGTHDGMDWDTAWDIADACGLDRNWFSADYSRLREIVPSTKPVAAATPRLVSRRIAAHVERAKQNRDSNPASKPDRRKTAP